MRAQSQLKTSLSFAAVTMIAVGIAGCGSGGKAPTPIASSPQMRVLQSGDIWQYSVTGKITAQDGTTSTLRPGSTYIRSIAAAPQGGLNGGPGLGLTENSNFLLDTNVRISNIITDVIQKSDRTIYEVADNRETDGNFEFADLNSATDFKQNPPLEILGSGYQPFLPGLWSASTGLSSGSSYSVYIVTKGANSTDVTTTSVTNQEQYSLTVIGQEVVSIPAGTFNAWKVNSTAHYVQQGLTINNTAWWVPQLGSFVKMQQISQQAGKSASGGSVGPPVVTETQFLTYTLTSTNVPH